MAFVMGGGEDDYIIIILVSYLSFSFKLLIFQNNHWKLFVLALQEMDILIQVTRSYQIQIKDINDMIKNYLEKLVLMLQKLLFHKQSSNFLAWKL